MGRPVSDQYVVIFCDARLREATVARFGTRRVAEASMYDELRSQFHEPDDFALLYAGELGDDLKFLKSTRGVKARVKITRERRSAEEVSHDDVRAALETMRLKEVADMFGISRYQVSKIRKEET